MTDNNRQGTGLSRRRVLRVGGAAGVAGVTGLTGYAGSVAGAQELDEITVGVVEPYSGSYAFLGEAETQGAELAAQDLEEDLGVTVNVRTADTETDPDTGVQRLERLVLREDVQLAMGGVSSAVAIKMGQWASQNGLAFIASGSHSDATTGSSCAQYMFRTPSSNTMLARTAGSAFAEYADSWYLMYADYTWGETGRDAMQSVLEDTGASVTGTIAAPLGAQDYTQELNTVAESDAEAAAIIFAGVDQRTIIQQFVNKGMHEEMKMGGPLLEDEVFWGVGKDVAQHAGVWATVWSPAVEMTPGGQPAGGNATGNASGNATGGGGGNRVLDFMERIQSEYDTTAYSRHYLGYTSMDQLVRAAARAGSADAEAVRGELEGHDYSDRGLLQGTQYWRQCDHQNVKPTYAVRALPAAEMVDDPYRIWFEPFAESAGDDVARSCEETGCSL